MGMGLETQDCVTMTFYGQHAVFGEMNEKVELGKKGSTERPTLFMSLELQHWRRIGAMNLSGKVGQASRLSSAEGAPRHGRFANGTGETPVLLCGSWRASRFRQMAADCADASGRWSIANIPIQCCGQSQFQRVGWLIAQQPF